MKFLALLGLGCISLSAQAASPIQCNDTLSFTPIQFSVLDDEASGPVIKFSGTYSGQALGALGFLAEFTEGWKARDFVLTLPNQPRKYIYSGDERVRHYTSSDVLGTSIVRFEYDGKVMAKAVTFQGLEITKLVTASMGVAYHVELRIDHAGKSWTYRKQYYENSCSSVNPKAFGVLGKFKRCDVTDEAQKQEAQLDMEEQAAKRCGPLKARQTSETFFEDAAACIHYTRGFLASAEFVCE